MKYLQYRNLKELKRSEYVLVDVVEVKGPEDFYELENQ